MISKRSRILLYICLKLTSLVIRIREGHQINVTISKVANFFFQNDDIGYYRFIVIIP